MTHTPPFRADHIGSLIRPKALREAYKEYAGGRMSDAGFAHAQDDAVKTAVQVQEDAGLDAVTDGEYRRRSWFAGFVDSVEGAGEPEADGNPRAESWPRSTSMSRYDPRSLPGARRRGQLP